MAKLMQMETIRGRRMLVRAEDVEFFVHADGFIWMSAPFGTCVERLVPFAHAIDINAADDAPEVNR